MCVYTCFGCISCHSTHMQSFSPLVQKLCLYFKDCQFYSVGKKTLPMSALYIITYSTPISRVYVIEFCIHHFKILGHVYKYFKHFSHFICFVISIGRQSDQTLKEFFGSLYKSVHSVPIARVRLNLFCLMGRIGRLLIEGLLSFLHAVM